MHSIDDTRDDTGQLYVFSPAYRAHQDENVLTIGTDVRYSRRELASVLHVTHTVSAARLTKICKRLKIVTVKDILSIPMIDWTRISGMGEATLRVLLEVLIHHNVPSHRIDEWMYQELKGQKLLRWKTMVTHASKKTRRAGKHGV